MAPRRTRAARRRGPGGAIRRSLSLLAFLPVASRAPAYVRLLWSLVTDERIPGARKALLAGALGYVVLGHDVIPDEIPVLGGLDDLVVVVLAVDAFLDGVPADLLAEKLDELGIDRSAYERDVAQIRRLTPGPIRRAVRRAPRALDLAARAVSQSGIGPRVRAWISKEGSIA